MLVYPTREHAETHGWAVENGHFEKGWHLDLKNANFFHQTTGKSFRIEVITIKLLRERRTITCTNRVHLQMIMAENPVKETEPSRTIAYVTLTWAVDIGHEEHGLSYQNDVLAESAKFDQVVCDKVNERLTKSVGVGDFEYETEPGD